MEIIVENLFYLKLIAIWLFKELNHVFTSQPVCIGIILSLERKNESEL